MVRLFENGNECHSILGKTQMNLKIKNTESFKGSGEMSPAKEPAGRQLWERKHRVTHEFIRGATREGENKTVSTVCQ